MKKYSFSSLLFNIVMACFITAILLPFTGVAMAQCVGVTCIVLPHLSYFNKTAMLHGTLRVGILKETWLPVIKENFYADAPHMARSTDMSSYVNNNVINLAEAGVNPNVLINNTVYPIATAAYNPQALIIPLRWFDTENVRLVNVTAKQYAFDGVKEMTKQLKKTLVERIAAATTHSWAPSTNAALTPILTATGAIRPDTGRRALTLADVARLQYSFDRADIPASGRVLVLCPEHRQDLLNEDRALFKAFGELRSGQILPLYGFDVYVYNRNPLYTTAGAKKAFGSVAVPATDCYASVVYHESEVMIAEGTLDVFFRPKNINTEGRADELGLQMFHIGTSIRNKAIGAIYSGV